VFTVTNIATENTDAVPPAHAVPRMPKAANRGLQRCRGPRAPLTCLAPLTAWQSLCTGHVNASLEDCVALAFADGNRPSGNSRLPSALRRSARLSSATVRPSRKQAEAFRLRQDLGTLGAYYEDVRWWGSGKGNSTALDQTQTGRLWTLPTVDYVDGDSLALRQARDPRALQRRSMHKDILAAPI
jgi:hypothetical protein